MPSLSINVAAQICACTLVRPCIYSQPQRSWFHNIFPPQPRSCHQFHWAGPFIFQLPIYSTQSSQKNPFILIFLAGPKTGKITLFSWGTGRCLVTELLELLLRASGFGDLVHLKVHSVVQGTGFTHGDNITDPDIPEARDRSTDMSLNRLYFQM